MQVESALTRLLLTLNGVIVVDNALASLMYGSFEDPKSGNVPNRPRSVKAQLDVPSNQKKVAAV